LLGRNERKEGRKGKRGAGLVCSSIFFQLDLFFTSTAIPSGRSSLDNAEPILAPHEAKIVGFVF
jgi:hypothetical protein